MMDRLLNLKGGKNAPVAGNVRPSLGAPVLAPRYPAGESSLTVSDSQIAKALAAKKRRKPGAAMTAAETRALVGATGARSTFGLRQNAGPKKR